jgi:transcriptional pleiotropic regulator of transition state genes
MKATGVVRKLDQLGRIVFPIELRRALDIEDGDSLEIFVDEGRIYLKKYEPACTYCGEANGVKMFKGKYICPGCLKELKEL